eukprot:CAMPEP_0175138352 /NCGR_PEP_ID=MMETSP0087-20121206/10301_1 /TAXON_ID=136419 /ORGANISM="Unknown Unknown, Strain D1" /LENGTH=653 /DNA_ID=CAMNT_0016421245 /DNA_START=46 /DNA_END=2008 /DNA_ORIENTATION=-
MSEGTSYISEPLCNGKVVVVTTFGELDIELWSKECPLACRNFVQLCLEGYYNGCIFHRIIKNFMAQTGDPTGSGMGGESIYDGEPFKDEFHQRLRFNRRGMVAMANENEPNTNGSQFFVTLSNCEWLAKKHTLFGKVTGESIFNVVKFDDVETDKDDRPLYEPPRVVRTDVLLNPFPDIKPRPSAAELKALRDAKKKKKKGKKNLSLLSFGEEQNEADSELAGLAEEEEGGRGGGGGGGGKSKSAHDLVEDQRLSKQPGAAAGSSSSSAKKKRAAQDAAAAASRDLLSKQLEEEDDDEVAQAIADRKAAFKKEQQQLLRSIKGKGGEEDTGGKSKKKDKELSRAKQLRNEKRERDAQRERAFKVTEGTSTTDNLFSAFEQRRKKYKNRSSSSKNRESDTLAKLAAFTQSIRNAPASGKKEVQQGVPEEDKEEEDKEDDDDTVEPSSASAANREAAGEENEEEKEEEEKVEKSGRWLSDTDEDEAELQDMSWLQHKVKFTSRPQDFDSMARDQDAYEYSIEDPRNPNNNFATSGYHKKGGKGKQVASEYAKATRNVDEAKRRHAGYQDAVKENLKDLETLDLESLAQRAEEVKLADAAAEAEVRNDSVETGIEGAEVETGAEAEAGTRAEREDLETGLEIEIGTETAGGVSLEE